MSRFWSVGLALLLASASASAQVGDAARAKVLFNRAESHFEAEEYQPALDLYREAFKIKPLPGFLFNLGQCHRLLGRCDKAVFFFKRYLARLPEAPNRAVAEELIGVCEGILAKEKAEAAETAEREKKQQEQKRLEQGKQKASTPTKQRRKLRPLWFWATAGTAAALLITGAVTGGLTISKSREYNEEDTDPARRQELKDAGESLGWASNITLGLGVAAAAGAAVLYFFTDLGGESTGETRATLAPMSGGGAFVVEGRF